MSFNKFFCLLAIMFLIDSIPSVALADPYCKDGNKSGENSLTSFEESFGYLLRDISGHFENAKLEPTNDSSVDVSELLALLGEQGFFAGNDPDKFTYGQSLFQKALNDVSRKNGEKGEIRVFNFANDQKTPISWSLSHINENGEEEIFLIFKNRSDSALSAIKWRANIVLAKVPEKTTKEWSLQDQLKQARWTSLSKLKPPASTEVHFISAKEEDNNEQISAIKPSPLRQLLNEAEENSSLKKEIRNADGELIALQLRYHSEKDLHGAIRIIEHTFKDDPRTKRVAGTTTLSLTGDMGLSASIIGSLEHITSQGELDEKTKKMNEDYAVIEQNLASREFIDAVIMVLGAGTQVGVKEGKYPEWEQLKARYPLRMVGQNPALAPDAMAAVREGVETFLGYQNFSKRHLTSAQESTRLVPELLRQLSRLEPKTPTRILTRLQSLPNSYRWMIIGKFFRYNEAEKIFKPVDTSKEELLLKDIEIILNTPNAVIQLDDLLYRHRSNVGYAPDKVKPEGMSQPDRLLLIELALKAAGMDAEAFPTNHSPWNLQGVLGVDKFTAVRLLGDSTDPNPKINEALRVIEQGDASGILWSNSGLPVAAAVALLQRGQEPHFAYKMTSELSKRSNRWLIAHLIIAHSRHDLNSYQSHGFKAFLASLRVKTQGGEYTDQFLANLISSPDTTALGFRFETRAMVLNFVRDLQLAGPKIEKALTASKR